MFKSAIVLSLAAAAAAQSSGCQSFIDTLGKDSSLSSCTSSMIKAGSAFNAQSANAQSVSQSLSAVCASTSSCSETTIRQKLSDFASACSAELAGGSNKDVVAKYDVLYAFIPFSKAVCAKDDSGNLCATASGSNSVNLVNGGQMQVQDALKYVGASNAPNATTFANTNLLFGFLSAQTSNLCTSCTRNVLTPYVNWETSLPYVPTLDKSVYLSGQNGLYSAIQSKCGDNFLQGTVNAAGGLSGGIVPSAADRTVTGSSLAAAAAALGAVAAAML